MERSSPRGPCSLSYLTTLSLFVPCRPHCCRYIVLLLSGTAVRLLTRLSISSRTHVFSFSARALSIRVNLVPPLDSSCFDSTSASTRLIVYWRFRVCGATMVVSPVRTGRRFSTELRALRDRCFTIRYVEEYWGEMREKKCTLDEKKKLFSSFAGRCWCCPRPGSS